MTDYRKQAAERDAMLDIVKTVAIPVAWTDAHRIKALQSLVGVLASAIKIGRGRLSGDAEPYPGACVGVLNHATEAVNIARATGLIPHEDR